MIFAKSQSVNQPHRSPIKFPPLRIPGQSLNEEITRLSERIDSRLLPAFIFVLLTLFEWYRWGTDLRTNPWPLTLITVLLLPYTAWAIAKHRKQMAKLRLGLDGERTVGQSLENLRAYGYQVFHDIPGIGFNIDHVIVGPAGIYTIETKTLSKPARGNPTITYDGDILRRDDGWEMGQHLVQARAQASWLADLLNQGRRAKYYIRPVVLFPGWWVKNIAPSEKRDILVLNEKALPHFLANEPDTLTSDAVETAANCIMQYCQLSGTSRKAVA